MLSELWHVPEVLFQMQAVPLVGVQLVCGNPSHAEANVTHVAVTAFQEHMAPDELQFGWVKLEQVLSPLASHIPVVGLYWQLVSALQATVPRSELQVFCLQRPFVASHMQSDVQSALILDSHAVMLEESTQVLFLTMQELFWLQVVVVNVLHGGCVTLAMEHEFVAALN